MIGILTGCGLGFDHTLFMTKSNIGVDIDTKPPTAEISVARRELVIAPSFEGGQIPPVLAGFNTGNRLLFGFDVSSVFAGGDAALTLSKSGKGETHGAKLCLNQPPIGKPHIGPISLGGDYPLPTAGEIHPFVFGTDTSFGLKVAWSGMTAQFPDTVKIGFNRKELAYAPVFGQEAPKNEDGTSTVPDCKYSVEMPAFLASIEVGADVSSPQSFNSKYRQSFSTGAAAIELAGDLSVKKLMLSRLDISSQKAATIIETEKEKVTKIEKYITNSSGNIDNAKLQDLLSKSQAGSPVVITDTVIKKINSAKTPNEVKELLFDPLDAAIEPLYKCLPTENQ
jgi:hypothetical protein